MLVQRSHLQPHGRAPLGHQGKKHRAVQKWLCEVRKGNTPDARPLFLLSPAQRHAQLVQLKMLDLNISARMLRSSECAPVCVWYAQVTLTWRYGGMSASVAGDVVGGWHHNVPLQRKQTGLWAALKAGEAISAVPLQLTASGLRQKIVKNYSNCRKFPLKCQIGRYLSPFTSAEFAKQFVAQSKTKFKLDSDMLESGSLTRQ
eukprot:1161241-Pelagomonas_calceolata.AAC.7